MADTIYRIVIAVIGLLTIFYLVLHTRTKKNNRKEDKDVSNIKKVVFLSILIGTLTIACCILCPYWWTCTIFTMGMIKSEEKFRKDRRYLKETGKITADGRTKWREVVELCIRSVTYLVGGGLVFIEDIEISHSYYDFLAKLCGCGMIIFITRLSCKKDE